MSKNFFQELSDAQLKIGSIFQELLNENNAYKKESEELSKTLTNIKEDMKLLTEKNRNLVQYNENLRKIITGFFKPFLNSHLPKEFKKSEGIILEYLHNYYSNLWEKVKNLLQFNYLNDLDFTIGCEITNIILNESCGNSIRNSGFHKEDVIRKDIDSPNKLGFLIQSFNDKPSENSNTFKRIKLDEQHDNTVVRSENKNIEKREDTELVEVTEDNLIENKVYCSPKRNVIGDKSPVFKDLRIKKVDNSEGEPNKSSSLKLLNEKFLLKPSDVMVSPLKRSFTPPNSPSSKKGPITPKRRVVKLAIKSPKSQLKRSNSREAEISTGGVRKLTQTMLNVDCFKKGYIEKRLKDCENLNVRVDTKVPDDGEDDVIMDSPKKKEQRLDELSKVKKKIDPSFTTTSGVDLDETYISSSLIRNCRLTGKHVLEKILENETPFKRPIREKSPEYDSVPFVYKRKALRKKADRLKLPGHPCAECHQYYKEAWGDEFNTENMKRELNKCSRHRDKFAPSHDDTPAGYWKPYLTSTTVSPSKDDTLRE